MATSDTTLDMQESDLIAQLGEFLPALFTKAETRPTTVELRESFDVWEVDTGRLKEVIETGEIPTHQPKYQHHQIDINGRAEVYALTKKSSPDPQRVFKAARSPIARGIEEAVVRLDAEIDEETQARLLVVRTLSIYAFSLSDGRVYLAFVPPDFKTLEAGQYLNNADFIRALSELTEAMPRRKELKGG